MLGRLMGDKMLLLLHWLLLVVVLLLLLLRGQDLLLVIGGHPVRPCSPGGCGSSSWKRVDRLGWSCGTYRALCTV